ncbi:MAG: acyltransferase [Lachnospiraceae bacterium]|nr:acyltransferase [Lachnospiraceae bacterium]
MSVKKRMANYELLRGAAMVMIITLHFLSHSDRILALHEPVSAVRLAGTALEFLSVAAVNTYVLISGYLGVQSSFKPSKAVTLLFQIWFYALLIPLVLALAGFPVKASEEGIYGLIWYLFPIETEHYWFAASYLMLYLLTPVLNGAARAMSKRQFQITLGGLLILFCGIKSISPVVFAFDKYGYDLPWFICVYLVAAYLGRFGWKLAEKRCWLFYFFSSGICFGINIGMYFLSSYSDNFEYYFTVPYHYNFLFCLTASIGLFYGFSRLRIREGRLADGIRRMGGLCFGVYLLHEHVDLRYRWYGWVRGIVNPSGRDGMTAFLAEWLVSVLLLFTAGIFIDYLRSRLFRAVSLRLENTAPGRFLKKLDREMEGKEHGYKNEKA